MDDMKHFWVSFVEGRISVPEMLALTKERPELLDWLTSIADPKFKTHRIKKHMRTTSLFIKNWSFLLMQNCKYRSMFMKGWEAS